MPAGLVIKYVLIFFNLKKKHLQKVKSALVVAVVAFLESLINNRNDKL
jgi:hypothetical protein